MDDKYQKLLNSNKFNRISFAVDYIAQIKDMQGNVQLEDFAQCLAKLYDDSFKDGQVDVLERQTSNNFRELDKLYDS